MKKISSYLSVLALLLIATSIMGCKSPGHNPAGVFGSDAEYGMGMDGSIAMGDRFSGGAEHPGMF
ncbi:MAG: hypothetical protein KAG97_05725, partial [Victivallales bacterium]|nr:hypothetical protein [Victivallales bacterium]